MLKPEDILRALAAARGDAICVPTMTTAPAWRTLAPDDLSVTCVGFMGGASSLGLGLALARPDRRVIVFDGDGSLLMQLGSLATIAGAQARNLTHLVFKNGVYHTSGAQGIPGGLTVRSEEHTSELQSPCNLVCRLLLEKKKKKTTDRLFYT